MTIQRTQLRLIGSRYLVLAELDKSLFKKKLLACCPASELRGGYACSVVAGPQSPSDPSRQLREIRESRGGYARSVVAGPQGPSTSDPSRQLREIRKSLGPSLVPVIPIRMPFTAGSF